MPITCTSNIKFDVMYLYKSRSETTAFDHVRYAKCDKISRRRINKSSHTIYYQFAYNQNQFFCLLDHTSCNWYYFFSRTSPYHVRLECQVRYYVIQDAAFINQEPRSETSAFDQSYFRRRQNTNNGCQHVLRPKHRGVFRRFRCPFAAVWTMSWREFGWWACRIPWKTYWRISTYFSGDVWPSKGVCCFSGDNSLKIWNLWSK